MDIQAILFDMDGLMIDTEPISREAWRRAGAEFGYSISNELYQGMVGRAVSEDQRILLAAFGADFPFDAINQRRVEVYRALLENGVPLKPGVVELLDWVDARGLLKAVGSSTRRELVLHKLELSGLRARFEIVVCADDVGRGKPAPDIFLEAARRLGVTPGECLVLEDSEAGVQAAAAAGMRVIVVPDMAPPSAQVRAQALAVLPSLAQVKNVLNQAGIFRSA
jgi:HAD superfamily hydrolase (TIGR01509 family)